MIEGFPANKVLAKIDLIIGDDNICLEFYSQPVDGEYIDHAIQSSTSPNQDYRLFSFKEDNAQLLENDSFFVCNYLRRLSGETVQLICKITPLYYELQGEYNKGKAVFIRSVGERIREKIFLVAPITQSFRFFDPSIRDLAFKARSISKYYERIENSRELLSNFFAYDAIAVDILVQAFLKVRDDDFRFAIETGDYSNSYQELLQDIEVILVGKKVNIDKDFKGVTFSKEGINGDTIKLYPEDLSHGELKRLSLFIWLKYNNIENSIVLIDEIEIALHPDWQYQIVRDLETWAPSNQYILATHSYELCHALTPAHVKEISPRLLNK
jgi:hypothetical protein